ncbi:MAG TPA: PDZ domain-containing protein [Thermoanaerobaculia bacterium]|nr:PDZ domain-containing protein [Thermoanaerobaculia bacterium]
MASKLAASRLRGGGPLVAVLLCCGCAAQPRPAGPAGPIVAADAGRSCASAIPGVETVDASRALRRQHGLAEDVHGAMIVEVLAGGPAAQAGLAVWDVVERIDDQEILSTSDFDDRMNEAKCGDTLRVTFRRGGAQRTTSIIPVDSMGFYTAACRQGLATGCFRQGWLIAAGVGVAADGKRAEELYDQACRLGSGGACCELARSRSEPERARERVELLERACALHYAGGCVDLAFRYSTGEDGVARDDTRAAPLFVAACDGGEPAGCFNAGLTLAEGRGAPADLAAAVVAYEDGCRGGISAACSNLGLAYDEGRGVAAAPDKAATFYLRGCTGSSLTPGSATACRNLGVLLRDGRGVEQDPGQAVELFTQVCDGMPADPHDQNAEDDAAAAAASACSLLGAQYAHGSGVAADWDRAIALSKQGCAGGDAFGCFNLGAVYLNGEGAGRDEATALSYFRSACDRGDGKGCFQVALMFSQGLGAARSDEQAAAFYQRACDAGSGTGCVNLGGMYTSDVSKTLALFERGCDLGEPVACFNLANHYTDGTGVKADPARAAALYAQACSGGYEAACAKASPPR